MTVTKIYVELSDKEYNALKILASKTGWSVVNELQSLVKKKLHEEMNTLEVQHNEHTS